MTSVLTIVFIFYHFICLEASQIEIDGYGDVIGIDLGTTYCSVAVMVNGTVEIIPNDQGNRITPSYVAFTDTQRLIGDTAKYQAARNPWNTIYDISRMIGTKYNDKTLQKYMKLWPFQVINVTDKPYVQITFKGEEHTFAPEAIQAMLLSKMKQFAEMYLGKQVKYAVISVPNHFNAMQQRTLRDIGTIAGLTIIRMVKAPIAAAIAYGLHKNVTDKNIIVYDLGGGTLDVSALTLDDGAFQVISISGDTYLGGQDFDDRVMNHFIKVFKRKYKINLRSSKIALARLRKQVEMAKRALSSTTQIRIDIDNFVKGIDFSKTLTRATFEELNNDLFRQTLKPLDIVLNHAGIKKSEIYEIIMVGGSTRIPKIQKLVQDFFNGKEVNRVVNPDEAVAYGVAVKGGIISGDKNAPLIFVMDVTSFSLGVAGSGGVMTKIIEKHSIIPITKSIVMGLPEDKQSYAEIYIYQGERAMTEDNIFLGTLTLNGIAPAPKGLGKIEVTCFIDSDGLITVSVMDKKSGNKSSMIMPDIGTLSQKQIDEMSEMIKEFEEQDQRRIETERAKNILESTAYKLKHQLDDELINLSVEGRKILYQAVNDMINWLDHNPNANVDEYRQKHQKLDEYVAHVLMDGYQQDTQQTVGVDNVEKISENNDVGGDVDGEQGSNMYINALVGLCTAIAIICGWYVITTRSKHTQEIAEEDVIKYEQKEGEMSMECKENEDIYKGRREVKVWLETKVKLPQYYHLFIENGVESLNVMQILTKQELDEIGITTIGHRVQILNEIQKLKQESNHNETGYIYR